MTTKRRMNAKLGIIGLAILAPLGADAAKVTGLDFSGSKNEITITTDSPVTFDKQENKDDKQIVLDLKDTSLSKGASRQMDTSSFDSNIVLISPYEVGGGSKDSRVVIQLRDSTSANVTQQGNVLKISVPKSGGTSAAAPSAPAAKDTSAADMPAAPPSDEIPPPSEAIPAPEADSATPPAVGTTSAATAAATPNNPTTGLKDKLAAFIESRETHRFAGKPITLKVRDADLTDVFRLIGDTSGFNIIVGDDVKGKVSLSLEDVPWDQALDVILRTQKLGAERSNNLLRIVTLTSLTQEKQAELAAKLAVDASAPRVTRVFPINYAKLDDLAGMLNKLSANQAAPPVSGGAASASTVQIGLVVTDTRTNSIVVRDTVENIERDRKLIELLDTQTPQVMIEGKVIEATENFGKSIGGSIGFGKGQGVSQYFGSFAGANPVDPLFSNGGGTSVFANGAAINATTPTPGGSFGLSPEFAFLPGNIRLNALLNLQENDSNVRIISSPKAVVLDKEKANIIEGTPVLVPNTSQSAQGPVNTPIIQQANLSLDVTPTVTNEGSVLMQLAISRDVPVPLNGGFAVGTRNMTTKVLVESGSTLVMGGIYTKETSDSSFGFPILRKIPILGVLFGNDSSSDLKTELFFFITPRILNAKEAGITGS